MVGLTDKDRLTSLLFRLGDQPLDTHDIGTGGVDADDAVDGLIHISQIADRRIEKPEDVLSEGQMVDAKITAIDEEKHKISLSIRALLAPAAEESAEEAPVEE